MDGMMVKGSALPVPVKAAYRHWLDRLNGGLWDIEHYRWVWDDERHAPRTPRGNAMRAMHAAVVVTAENKAYVGVAKCAWQDRYDRRKGHAMAMGRALKAACLNGQAHHRFDCELRGVALRDACRTLVERRMGWTR